MGGARQHTRASRPGPIPSPSSRQPKKRAEPDGSSRSDLLRLDPSGEVCSADGRDDGKGMRSQASPIPEPEVPPPEALHPEASGDSAAGETTGTRHWVG